jgi:hypothetical protein
MAAVAVERPQTDPQLPLGAADAFGRVCRVADL